MDANLNPNVPAKVNQTSSSAVDTSLELANTVIAIVKEVGEMLNSVPYVKSLSGVILQIIRVRDEIKANKQRCREIIDKVLRMSKSIYEKLAEVAQSDQREKLSRLENQLNEHTRALTAVYEALERHRSGRSGLSRLVNRGLDDLNEHDRRLDELNTQLILDIIFRLTMEHAASGLISNQQESSDTPGHILPPKPYLMVERETQFNTVRKILLGPEPSRIAILGGGGFGKTTLARAILHDSEISAHYMLRYFLSCEAMLNTDALVLGIANMLDIKATSSVMLGSIRRKLETSTTLLCLDNFETPWEPPATRTNIEDALASIASIPHLSIIITIRGAQRPSKIRWSHPDLLPPLPTLSSDSAQKILMDICPGHVVDDFTQQLLDGVDGIPLAITLISNLLRDGESSRELWTRWSKEKTAVIENGGKGREANLDTSITLSVNSPRMAQDPGCLTLLAALSLLPDGLPLASIEQFEEYLGLDGIRKLLRTLRAVALIKPDDSTPSSRIQMLSPIRLFCHQFLSSEISLVLGLISEYYIRLMYFARGGQAIPQIYAQITPEIRNVHSIFQKVFSDYYQRDMGTLIESTAILTDWSVYIGYLNQDTIQMALERSTNYPLPCADCLFSLGRLCKSETDYTTAENCLRDAIELCKQNNATIGEAEAWSELGDVFRFVTQLDQAELAFKASFDLFYQVNDERGQANALIDLGTLYMSKYQYSEAEANMMSALETFKQMQQNIGIANAANSLTNLHNTLNNLSKSETFATEALTAAKEANYALGEAIALRNQGRISLRMDSVVNARQLIEQALVILEQLNDPISRFNAVIDLGEAYIRSDQLSAAEALLTTSAKVELDLIQIPLIFTTLGWVYICGNRFDKAEPLLYQALLHFRKIEDKDRQAHVLAHLGTVYFRSNRLDDAEQMLNSIQNLGQWSNVDMRRLWVLGDLHIVKGQLEDAEGFLDQAMTFANQDKCSYQQGNILRSIGTIHIKRGHVDLAIDQFKQALEFHRKAQWVSEQATDLQRLGEAYEMSGRSEDAAAVFKMAEELMDSVCEARELKL